jgi:hypothetical protein
MVGSSGSDMPVRLTDEGGRRNPLGRRRALLVGRNRRLGTRRHDEHLVIVEPVEDPEILPDHAPDEGSSWRERGLEVPGPRKRGRRERAHRRRDRAVRGRPR